MAQISIISELDLKYSIIERFIDNKSKILFNEKTKKEYIKYFEEEKKCQINIIDKEKSFNLKNLDILLTNYKTNEFDFFILDEILNEIENPISFIKNACRISKNVILTFENFGNIKKRIKFLFKGQSNNLYYEKLELKLSKWCFSFNDIVKILNEAEIFIEKGIYYKKGNIFNIFELSNNPNLFGENFILLLQDNKDNKIENYSLSGKILV